MNLGELLNEDWYTGAIVDTGATPMCMTTRMHVANAAEIWGDSPPYQVMRKTRAGRSLGRCFHATLSGAMACGRANGKDCVGGDFSATIVRFKA